MNHIATDKSNGKIKNMDICPMQPDIKELTGTLKLLANKIDTLIGFHQTIVKWLLVVVCIIALGRSAIDLGKDFFLPRAAQAKVQQ